jgi:GT2 family glycosyltransferase
VTVTVVIATCNRRASLLHTLDRLAALPEQPAVIVVDNGSSDGSPKAVREQHPRVDVIELPTNLGAAARTLGAARAATDCVAFADDDSWWAPGALPRAEALLAAHPDVALLAARVLVEPSGRLDPTCVLMRESPLPADPALPGPEILGFVACGAVARRSALLEVGGFDRRLQIGGEEALLSIDLAVAGWKLVYADDVVAHHRPASGLRPGRAVAQLRNELWTTWLRRPLPRALLQTLGLLRRSGPRAILPLLVALRGLRWVARERRVVPRRTERALRLLDP